MQAASTPSAPRIPATILQLLATLLGLAGTALVILQALFWITPGHADHRVVVFTALVPLIAAVVFAIAPRRAAEPGASHYALREPIAWVNLALPVLITFLTMILVGVGGSFDNFAGFALLLAANAGRNLRDFLRCLMLHRQHAR